MSDGVKRAARFTVALISVGVLAFLVHLGWGQLKIAWSMHRQWSPGWIGAAILSQFVVYLSIAGMLGISLSGAARRISPPFLVYCAFAFLFANRSLPGPAIAGVATLVYLLRGKQIAPVDAQAAAGSFYFADYAGFFTLIAAVSVPLFIDQPNHTTRTAYLVALSMIAVTAVLAILLFRSPTRVVTIVSAVIRSVQAAFPALRARGDWGSATSEAVHLLHERIMERTKVPHHLAAFYLLSLIMHASEISTILCGARAAGIHLSVTAAAASYVAGNLASIVSVLPGAIGFYEAGMIGTMHLSGHLSVGDATICALTYRVLSFWAPMPAVINLLLAVFRQGVSSLRPADSNAV